MIIKLVIPDSINSNKTHFFSKSRSWCSGNVTQVCLSILLSGSYSIVVCMLQLLLIYELRGSMHICYSFTQNCWIFFDETTMLYIRIADKKVKNREGGHR